MSMDDFAPDSILRTAFFTGHRIIREDEKPMLEEKVFRIITDAYLNGYRRFFCGCALGFDTIAAYQTIRLRDQYSDVQLILAIPCGTQADRWPSQDRDSYSRILELADKIIVLSPVYYQGAMQTRNRYMADRSSLCICWLRNMRGGTASTVRYALSLNRIMIVNLAVSDIRLSDQLRESAWNYMFISPSVNRNAVTVPLHLSQRRKLLFRNIRPSCCRKPR